MSMWYYFSAQQLQGSWTPHTETQAPKSVFQGETISQMYELHVDHLWNGHTALALHYVDWSSPGPPSTFKEGNSSFFPGKIHIASLERWATSLEDSLSKYTYFVLIHLQKKTKETGLLFYNIHQEGMFRIKGYYSLFFDYPCSFS